MAAELDQVVVEAALQVVVQVVVEAALQVVVEVE